MSTKFFTNSDENSLLKRFEGVFTHCANLFYFEALVGYFRTSGYFRIRPFLDKLDKIRILVGINVDKLAATSHAKGLLFLKSDEETKKELMQSFIEDIRTAKYDRETEEGILRFIQDLSEGKLEMRAHPHRKLHAKIYIFRPKNFNEYASGEVITGSSNFTDQGLGYGDYSNFEFNVALRDYADVKFAYDEFETMWEESVEVLAVDVKSVKQKTHLTDEYTPYEIFLKLLVEYFGSAIEYDPSSASDMPPGYHSLSYQIDAVNDGYNKMMKHGGFFLADVVGLGKTIIAALIAKKFFFHNGFPEFRSRTLIVIPPALEANWEQTKEDFNLDNCDLITNGSLHKVKNPQNYDLIIVDEAHKFRSDTADMYQLLQTLCKTPCRPMPGTGERLAKKVILISATPLNNRPNDIANLVFLFQDSKASTLEIANLQRFFRGHIDRYKALRHEDDMAKVKTEVKAIYASIRVKIVEPLTVRRTRTDLTGSESYKKDLDEQGIVFPKVEKPKKILYKMFPRLETLYDETMKLIGDQTQGLTYNRYRAIGNLKPAKRKKYQAAESVSLELAMIMKVMLVKRIDSSFYAFKKSLGRFHDATRAMVAMFKTGKIFIAPDLPVSQYILEGREDDLLRMVEEKKAAGEAADVCEPDDFEHGFYEGLLHDEQILDDLVKRWEKIAEDPKWDTFLAKLRGEFFERKRNPSGKLVIFSESKETTEYLAERLEKVGVKGVIKVDSSNRRDLADTVRRNFDANLKAELQESKYNILLTTEVLAEGINLHRANVLVNYDTPWNATRLMQRIGRLNRIGTKADSIWAYHFFPTSEVEDDIELKKKSIMKLQAFHSALGEDSQIYDEEAEETESFGLFDKDLEEGRDERLQYLMLLRKLRVEQPELFKRIRNMPLKVRVGRNEGQPAGGTLCFIRDKKRNGFYEINSEGALSELTFVEMAQRFETSDKEGRVPLHEHHHEQVLKAVETFAVKGEADGHAAIAAEHPAGPNEARAIEFLGALSKLTEANAQEREGLEAARKAIRQGRFLKLHRELNKIQKENKTTPIKPVLLLEKAIAVISGYPLIESAKKAETVLPENTAFQPDPEIILSVSFRDQQS